MGESRDPSQKDGESRAIERFIVKEYIISISKQLKDFGPLKNFWWDVKKREEALGRPRDITSTPEGKKLLDDFISKKKHWIKCNKCIRCNRFIKFCKKCRRNEFINYENLVSDKPVTCSNGYIAGCWEATRLYVIKEL